MLRRHHRFFQTLQVIRDTVLVIWSFFAAYELRFSIPQLLPYTVVSQLDETLTVGFLLALIWPMVAWFSGLYQSRRARSLWHELFDVARVSVLSFVVLVTVTYFVRDERYSRVVLLLWMAINIVSVAGIRIFSGATLRTLRARGFNLRHVLIVGVDDLAAQVIEAVHAHSSLGLRVAGVVGQEGDSDRVGERVAGVPIIGTMGQISEILQRTSADQVIVALPIQKIGALGQLMEILSKETVDVRLVPDFYQYVTLCGSIEEFSGLPMINLQATPLSGWNMVSKRIFDFALTSVGLLLVSPLMLGLMAAVRFSSKGPIFYGQERVGMDGRPFTMYKFRTMRIDAETAGAQMAVKGDPRCTRIGGFLRRTSLDELPQLWNVLTGDMSLVGPRPERPHFIETFKQEIPRYALRHKIKAGMTGWAQINGLRGGTSIAKRIELDLYYIENWSLALDIKILIRTVLGGFLSPHAY